MNTELHHQHTLNRIVPDMERGFAILTSYGQLQIEPGQLADRIRDLVAQHARLELMRASVPQADDATGDFFPPSLSEMADYMDAEMHRLDLGHLVPTTVRLDWAA